MPEPPVAHPPPPPSSLPAAPVAPSVPPMPPTPPPNLSPAAPPPPTAVPPPSPNRPFLRSQNKRNIENAPAAVVTAKPKPSATPLEDLPTSGIAKAKRARCPFQPICLMKGHNKFDFINRGRCHLGGPNQLSAAGQRDVAKAPTREQLVPRKKVRVVDQVEDIGAVEIRRALPEDFHQL